MVSTVHRDFVWSSDAHPLKNQGAAGLLARATFGNSGSSRESENTLDFKGQC